ncbi:MAG: NAD(P)-dependent oxidoreductase, partial [Candidatus Latescibacteria bacterium]|nr:NAD(P)-dependent oxidoreductase [Candidatus Latescibacterota bacterium]
AIDKLREHAEVEFYTVPELTAEHAEGVVGILANSVVFTPEFYATARDLRIVARWGVGFEKVDVPRATDHGVIVTVSPVHMVSVAEYAIAQWMATLKRVYTLNRNSHAGEFQIIRTYEAEGSTLGIWGLGRIGQAMAERARPLLRDSGRLLVYDLRPDIHEVAAQYNAEVVDDPRTLFEECDAISLHLSGDHTVVTYDLLCAMKPHASLINPSRGNLVDDEAVNRAIKEDRLCYYVVDDPVNDTRAIHKDHPRIICTNHNAGITVESAIRLDECCVEQIIDAVEGRTPNHVLNTDVLDHPRVQGFLQ